MSAHRSFARQAFRHQGFTLMELLIAIAIIAILAAIAFPSYQTFIQRARIDNARAVMMDVVKFMERHYAGGAYISPPGGPSPSSRSASQPSATFCKDRAGGTPCDGPGISSVLSSEAASSLRYRITLENVSPTDFNLVAVPNPGMYSDATLADTRLHIFYNSTTSTFSRCNTAGLASARNNADPGNNCETL